MMRRDGCHLPASAWKLVHVQSAARTGSAQRGGKVEGFLQVRKSGWAEWSRYHRVEKVRIEYRVRRFGVMDRVVDAPGETLGKKK